MRQRGNRFPTASFCGGYISSGSVIKDLPASAVDASSIPGSGRCPGEENGSPYVFFPGKSQGQRSLAGYSPWGHKRVGHNLRIKQQQ